MSDIDAKNKINDKLQSLINDSTHLDKSLLKKIKPSSYSKSLSLNDKYPSVDYKIFALSLARGNPHLYAELSDKDWDKFKKIYHKSHMSMKKSLDISEKERDDFIEDVKTLQKMFLNHKLKFSYKPKESYEIQNCQADMRVLDKYNTIFRPNHWGQRKLMNSEVDYLNKLYQHLNINPKDGSDWRTKTINVVYPGSAPGRHSILLMEMFPHIIFYFWDPNPFDHILSHLDKIRRGLMTMSDVRQEDVRIINKLKNRVYINPHLTGKDYDEWYSNSITNKEKNYVKQLGFFGSQHFLNLKHKPVCHGFMSDIRLFNFDPRMRILRLIERIEFKKNVKIKEELNITDDYEDKVNNHFNNRIYHRDMELQKKWFLDLKSVTGLLKFKLPMVTSELYPYLSGTVLLQAWGPFNTTECRLFCTDKSTIINYDPVKHKRQMDFCNLFMRQTEDMSNEKIGKYKLSEIFKNLIDPYYFKIDAFIEANILHDYMKLFGDSNINNIRHLIINLTQSIKYRTVKHLYTIPDDKHGYQLKKRNTMQYYFDSRMDYHSKHHDHVICELYGEFKTT